MDTPSIHDSIIAYNKELILAKSKITIEKYIHHINDNFYHIKTHFINELFELVTRHDCCVPHTYLEKYEVIKLNDSNKALRLFKKYNFLEDIDYEITINHGVRPQGGTYNTNTYHLTPKAFKEILMGSRDNNLYRKYYILLEECIKYYNDLQVQLLKLSEQSLLSKLDELNISIKELNETNKELIQSNNNLNETNKELIQSNKKLNKKIDKLTQSNNVLYISNLEQTLSIEKLNTSIQTFTKELIDTKIYLTEVSKNNVTEIHDSRCCNIFMLFKNNTIDNFYKIVRIQKRSAQKRIKELTYNDEHKLLFKIDSCTNAMQFCHTIKENFKNDVIDFNGTDFTVKDISITEIELRVIFFKIYNKRIIVI